MSKKIEICLDSVRSVCNAERAGANRVELCSALFDGGTTPSLGMLREARRRTKIAIQVMIRPRAGDFCYSREEFVVMKEDVKIFREEGASGMVFGILNPDGSVDVERNCELLELAPQLENTFHRAIDVTADWQDSLEKIIQLGFTRVLTSGLEDSVLEGSETIVAMIRKAGERIIIMPGCGITNRNFNRINRLINADEYHLFMDESLESSMTYRPNHIFMGGLLRPPEFLNKHSSIENISKIVQR